MNTSDIEMERMQLAAQQVLLHDGAGFAPRENLSRIVLRGSDRQTFLHGMCTQNIRDLQAGQGGEAFVTNVQGKVVGHIRIRCLHQALELIAAPGQATNLMRHFDKYIIREDVLLADESSDWTTWDIVGPESLRRLGISSSSPPPPCSAQAAQASRTSGGVELASFGDHIASFGDHIASFGDHIELSWPGEVGRIQRVQSELAVFQVQVPADRNAEFASWLSQRELVACSQAAGELWRVEIGFPLYGTDISLDNLPQEVDRNSLAISFTKGCYLGQETVARLDALGHVNRRLMGLLLPGEVAWDAGTEITVEGKVIAKVTSSAYSPRHGCILGLGYIRRGWDQPGTRLETQGGAATVLSIPLRDV